MLRTLGSYTDYWMHRKQFIAQYATATFMSYLFSVGHRTPHKITMSRKTGSVWMTELLPGWNQNNPLLGNGETVPFRFTPNIQDYITPVGVEGLFTSCLMATARSLTEPDLELDQYLSLFVRDELITWHMSNHRSVTDAQFRERVQANVTQVITKAQFLSCKTENDKVRTLTESYNLIKMLISLFFNRLSILKTPLAKTSLISFHKRATHKKWLKWNVHGCHGYRRTDLLKFNQ